MTTEMKELSVGQLLKSQAELHGEKEVIFDLYTRLTYNELEQKVEQLASGLQRLGIQRGDKIGVCLPNWHETAVIYFASARIGAVVVPFNPLYRHKEIEYILKNSEPKLLFVAEPFDTNIGIDRVLTLIDHVVTVRFEHPDLFKIQELYATEPVNDTSITINIEEDLFCILYTSGTTGLPKGVMTTHRSIVQCAFTIADEMSCGEDDVFIVPAPLFHIFGITCNLMTAIASGAQIVLMEKYHPEKVLQLIEQEKVSVHLGVPTMFLKELHHENFNKYDLSSLRIGMVGAAPITANQMKTIRREMDFNLCQSFGITETGTVTFTKQDDDEQIILESLGKPIDGAHIKIVDESRKDIPTGEIGEIAIKSFATMKGYYNMPEQTKKVMDEEGYYYSGDLGKLDDQGNLHFIGREKEMIIRGGFNIYPQEIESVLSKHPKVSEVAIIGIPDEVLGEVVCAVIQLKSGERSTAGEIKDYIGGRMAKYKVPSEVIFVNEFPLTASGKIQKMKLKEQFSQREDK